MIIQLFDARAWISLNLYVWLPGSPLKVHFRAKNDKNDGDANQLTLLPLFPARFLAMSINLQKSVFQGAIFARITQFKVLFNLAYIVKPSVGKSLLCLLTSHYLFPMRQ